jgi:hypothetical protein
VRSRIETYKTTLRLSDVQREIVVGFLAMRIWTSNGGRSYRLKWSRESATRSTGIFTGTTSGCFAADQKGWQDQLRP